MGIPAPEPTCLAVGQLCTPGVDTCCDTGMPTDCVDYYGDNMCMDCHRAGDLKSTCEALTGCIVGKDEFEWTACGQPGECDVEGNCCPDGSSCRVDSATGVRACFNGEAEQVNVVTCPEPEVTDPVNACASILDKKQCKKSPHCSYDKNARDANGKKGVCGDAPAPTPCTDLTHKTCKKKANKKRCKVQKTRQGKKKIKVCVDKN